MIARGQHGDGDKPVAVCTLERNNAPFSDTELRMVRLMCDQAVRRLDELKSGKVAGIPAERVIREARSALR